MTTRRHPRPDEMSFRLDPGDSITYSGAPGTAQELRVGAPKFNIIFTASDGAELLRMFEDERGLLQVEGDKDRWGEAATLFLRDMMIWSGLVGVRWKEEVIKATRQ